MYDVHIGGGGGGHEALLFTGSMKFWKYQKYLKVHTGALTDRL